MGADISHSLRGRYLIFQLADQAYAVSVASVAEIVPMAELARVAGGPSFLAGFLDIGGQLIAVISLRRLLRLPDRSRELYAPIVILKSRCERMALEVDAVREIADISDADAVPLRDGYALNDFALASVRRAGATVLLLAPERLLLEEERQRMSELAEMARDRLLAAEAAVE